MAEEKFIVKVIRKSIIRPVSISGEAKNPIEQVDQIYEQEFNNFDIGKFATELNRKDGKEADEKSLKMADGK